MSPDGLFTVTIPFATSHFAGDLSRALTHWSRFLPSNNTIASDGAAELVAPGVTILGTGVQTSVSCGRGCDAAVPCATSGDDPAIAVITPAIMSARFETGCLFIFSRCCIVDD
jgi:hypothetical protein